MTNAVADIVLIGPPAVGKGTLAAFMQQEYGIRTLSAGDLLRDEVEAGTELGQQAGPVMARGELLPDHIVVSVIAKRMQQADCANGVLFDGFPRTIGQAQALDTILASLGRPLLSVIEMQADEATITARFQTRVANTIAQGKAPRKDDNPETFARRIKVYYNETLMALPYYQAQGVLDTINAVQPVDNVRRDVFNALATRGCYPRVNSTPTALQTPTPS